MSPIIEQLLILQEKDRQIANLNAKLTQVPNDIESANEQLDHDKEAVSTAKKMLQDHESEQKNLEFDIDTRRKTITRLKEQQFETKKNEQFRALGNEVTRYEEEVDGLETQLLTLMEKQDSLEQKLGDAEAQLKKMSQHVEEELKELDQLQTNLSSQLNELQEEREKLAAKVATDALDIYDRLLSKKGVPIVVSTERNLCGGCHMKLVASTLVAAQSVADDSTLTHCENCGRILYSA